jgi:signal transduction histidine kinase
MTKGRAIDLGLAGFCGLMMALMWVFAEEETVPYHFLFLALAIVYGFRVWPMRKTTVVVILVTGITGLLFLRAYLIGTIGLEETTEIALMPLLMMAMVWHARRRETAMRSVRRMAEENAELLVQQHELLRETSHAIRTPITIARGFVDLAASESASADVAEHLGVVSRQLERTGTLSARLLSLAALDSNTDPHFDMVDIAAVVRESAKTWAATVDRLWSHDIGTPLYALADVTQVEAAVDALVENAVHFTTPRDTIRLSCRKIEGSVLIEVADSGPGIREEDRALVFQRFWHCTPPDGMVGSGLGLAMVSAIARAHGGEAAVSTASEGGAAITMTFPRPTVVEVASSASDEKRVASTSDQEPPRRRGNAAPAPSASTND